MKNKALVPKHILAQLDKPARTLARQLERSKKPVSMLAIHSDLGEYTSLLGKSTRSLEILVVRLSAAMKYGTK